MKIFIQLVNDSDKSCRGPVSVPTAKLIKLIKKIVKTFNLEHYPTYFEIIDVEPPLSVQPLVKGKHKFLERTLFQIYGLKTLSRDYFPHFV